MWEERRFAMLSYIWFGMITLSCICACFNGTMPELTASILSGGADAVKLCLKLLGMLCLWSGFMNIAEKSGLCGKLSRLMRPLLDFLLPDSRGHSEIKNAVAMNLTANLLGLGNAATPLGLGAMKKMQAVNDDKTTASQDMMTFVVMNTAAFRLIPSTVAALREAAGAAEPMDILFCMWISSFLSLTAAISAVKIVGRIKK